MKELVLVAPTVFSLSTITTFKRLGLKLNLTRGIDKKEEISAVSNGKSSDRRPREGFNKYSPRETGGKEKVGALDSTRYNSNEVHLSPEQPPVKFSFRWMAFCSVTR